MGFWATKPGRDVFATLDLRDGTTVAGWVFLCTVEERPPEEREVVLVPARGKRILVRPPGQDSFFESPDSALVVHGADVLRVGASAFPAEQVRSLGRLRVLSGKLRRRYAA
jgi:hypothetical protein